MRAITTTALLCLLAASAAAQSTKTAQHSYYESFAARLQGGIIYTLYSASFAETGDVIDCGQLTTGDGINPAVAATLEFRLSEDLGFGIGIGYAGRSGSLTRENTYPTRDSSGVEGTMVSELSLDAVMSYLEIQPDIRMALLEDYQNRTLGLIVGPRIGLPLSTSFTQRETVVSPDNAAFVVDGERTQERIITSGPFTTRSNVMLGLSAGLESLIPLSERVSLVPQVCIDYFFTDMLNDASWVNYGVRAEIGIRYSAGKKPVMDTIIPPPPPPPIIIVPPQVALQFNSFEGEVVTGNHLTATLPIVNAVFFDSAQAVVPTTYRTSLDASRVNPDPVKAHEWLLPRIAQLMEQNPDASILLQGASADVDDKGALGTQRAEAVKQVLQRMGVSSSRIRVEGRQMPTVPSNSAFEGGREENRRVDIFVKDAALQEWVTLERFAILQGRMNVTASHMGGDPSMRDSVRIAVKVDNKDTTFTGPLVDADISIDKQIPIDAASAVVGTSISSDGAYAQRDTMIDVAKLPRREIDLQTQDFEAILMFGYNSSELTDDVKGLLRQLSERLPERSTITILGSADILGSEARNKQLSEERAENTKAYIRSISGNKFSIEASSTTETFTVDTPQGRFLNRSIRITAATPQD